MISRAIAAFLGGFTLLNLVGNLIFPGFDANLWWIDLSPLPPALATVVLLLGASALLVYAIHPPRKMRWRCVTLAPILLLTIAALLDSLQPCRSV